MLKCCHISDTHDTFQDISMLIPEGTDIVFITGDLTYRGSPQELQRLKETLKRMVAKVSHVVITVGNHELGCEKDPQSWIDAMKEIGVKLLMHEAIEIEGYKIYGSPWSPEFGGWAYNYHRLTGQTMWQDIPDNTEILLTHGPLYGVLDYCHGGHVGCTDLRRKVERLPYLKYHLFGHIHEAHGIEMFNQVTCLNSSIMDGTYHFVNKPQFFELRRK